MTGVHQATCDGTLRQTDGLTTALTALSAEHRAVIIW